MTCESAYTLNDPNVSFHRLCFSKKIENSEIETAATIGYMLIIIVIIINNIFPLRTVLSVYVVRLRITLE